jgi:excisionase family DNA binding protein
MSDEILTVAEAAAHARISTGTIYALCSAGKIDHYRIGLGRGTIRIIKKALDVFLREGCKVSAVIPKAVTVADLRALR